MTAAGELEVLERAERMLAEVASARDAVDLVDLAAAARVYAQKAKLGAGAVNHATTVRLRAERKLAEIVDAGQASGQIAGRGGDTSNPRSAGIATLPALGIKNQRLSEARRIRDHFTDAQILELAADRTAQGKELTRTEVVRSANTSLKAQRVERLAANTPADLSSLSQFPVLYADPPWQYENSSTPDRRKIENHYPTMGLDQICALPVPAAEDAVLYLWATSPKLTEALSVMDAWGFKYRTNMVWVKDRIGMGFYARQRHELLLIGKRGSMPAPIESARPDSVIQAPRGQHSAKPDVVYELIERMYPGLAYCELFQRRPRNRWRGWGLEAT